MRRRDFIRLIGSSTAAWPLPLLAQQGERPRYIAILMGLAENDPETKERLVRFKNEMEKLGWSEGRNLRIEVRFAPAGAHVSQLAKELIALQPDVILAHSAQVAGALFKQTREIPVVFVNVSDPIGAALLSAWRAQAAISGGSPLRTGHRWQVARDVQRDCANCCARCHGGRPEKSGL